MTDSATTDDVPMLVRSATLGMLSDNIEVPGYDRDQLERSIIHIGVGGFHRAHMAVYIDDLCRLGNTEWSITGAGVLEGDAAMATTLRRQDYLYSLIVRGNRSTSTRVIGSIVDYVYAHPVGDDLVAAIADPATQLVSLTVTEGGYPVDDTTGLYAPDSPAAGPNTTFAIIAEALAARRHASGAPLTILSCDNIMSNGHAARTATVGAAQALEPSLLEWIDANVSFPNSMVDRITPATTNADRRWLLETHGLSDEWPVVAEPFRQWVVEDNFAGRRLPLEDLDVIVTDDVEPYERMKLQLLNAGHSCLAYLAALLDIEHVHSAMAEPAIAEFVSAFLDTEAGPVVPPVAGIDLDAYKHSLIERFSNPEIADQIARLCLDGSAKFPKFLLSTVRANVDADGPVELAALALAGWCHYLNGVSEAGQTIELSSDPLLSAAVGHAAASVEEPTAFLGFAAVFGTDLPHNERFASAFARSLTRLRTSGVRSTIALTLSELREPRDRLDS